MRIVIKKKKRVPIRIVKNNKRYFSYVDYVDYVCGWCKEIVGLPRNPGIHTDYICPHCNRTISSAESRAETFNNENGCQVYRGNGVTVNVNMNNINQNQQMCGGGGGGDLDDSGNGCLVIFLFFGLLFAILAALVS